VAVNDLKYNAPPRLIKYDIKIILLEIGYSKIFFSLKQYLVTKIFDKNIIKTHIKSLISFDTIS